MNETASLPLLYSGIELLDRVKHRNLFLRPLKNDRFTAGHHLFPLTLAEFPEAARWHPIVFIRSGASLGAVMVTSATPGVNGALDAEHRWKTPGYVPAYVRRYPFILIRSGEQLRLGLDPEAPHLSRTEGEAVFSQEGDTPALERIRAFCGAFDAAWRETEEFLAALDEHKLLAPGETTITGPAMGERKFSGFEIVDPARLVSLPDEVLRHGVKTGWVSAIEAHRASLRRWSDVPLGPVAEAA